MRPTLYGNRHAVAATGIASVIHQTAISAASAATRQAALSNPHPRRRQDEHRREQHRSAKDAGKPAFCGPARHPDTKRALLDAGKLSIMLMFIFMIMITYIPWLSTVVPNSLMGPEIIIK